MSENLVACEFEDSTNCVWNAQVQGNGIGESFVDVNGIAYYATDGKLPDFTLGETGVTLNNGHVWSNNDHLNIRTEGGTVNYHAEAKCGNIPAPPECSLKMQYAANDIGQTLIPWDHLGIADGSCVEWVQYAKTNYHYGENGESSYCIGGDDGEEVIPETQEPPFECPPNKVPGWLDENGNPQGCVDNNPTPLEPKELPLLEEVPEVVVEVPVIVDPVPEELANTGTGDVVVGLLIGLALLTTGVVLFIKGRKNK